MLDVSSLKTAVLSISKYTLCGSPNQPDTLSHSSSSSTSSMKHSLTTPVLTDLPFFYNPVTLSVCFTLLAISIPGILIPSVIPQNFVTQNAVHGPTEGISFGRWLSMQNCIPHPRLTKKESAFKQDLQMVLTNDRVWEALLYTMHLQLLKHLISVPEYSLFFMAFGFLIMPSLSFSASRNPIYSMKLFLLSFPKSKISLP